VNGSLIADSSRWPSERACNGSCDICGRADIPVVVWGGEDPGSGCEECWTALAEAWAALTPAEQEEALR